MASPKPRRDWLYLAIISTQLAGMLGASRHEAAEPRPKLTAAPPWLAKLAKQSST